MKNIRKKIEEIAVDDSSGWLEKARKRRKNRGWLRKSQDIAIRVLGTLKDRGMQQKELAKAMGVSPQQISKIVKGKQNLTLETISKLEQVLGISLFEIPKYQVKMEVEQKEVHANIHKEKRTSVAVREKWNDLNNQHWEPTKREENKQAA